MQKDTLMRSVYTICLIYFALVFLEFPTRPLALNCYARHSLSQTTLYFSPNQGYSHCKAYLFRCHWRRMWLVNRWGTIVSLTNSTEDFWNRDLLLVLYIPFPQFLKGLTWPRFIRSLHDCFIAKSQKHFSLLSSWRAIGVFGKWGRQA